MAYHKRKGDTSSTNGSRKVKKSKINRGKNLTLTFEDVERIGEEIVASPKELNKIITLLNEYDVIKDILQIRESEETEKIGRKISITLFKVFKDYFERGMMTKKAAYEEKKQLVAEWLLVKYSKFKNYIFEFIKTKLCFESSLQIDMLDIIIHLMKLEAEYMKLSPLDHYFPTSTYRGLIAALLLSNSGTVDSKVAADNFLVLEFAEKFRKYWDLQVYFYNQVPYILEDWKQKNNEQLRQAFANFYTILNTKLLFSDSPEELEENESYVTDKLPAIAFKSAKFKSNYQKSVLLILSAGISSEQIRSVLLILHKRIIPYMARPESLMDFLTDAYDSSGDESIPILALNSLFELMKKYNLEYPQFYTKLYSLLTPNLLYSRHRSRFFRLCDLFLSSTHLSASLVASFIKRLAKLSLTAGAPGVVIIIPFIYNLIKRHPSCMIMLHNTQADPHTYVDTFKEYETDPLITGAMGSSLWELETMMSHYHPNIATLAKIFKEPFRKPNYNMEDFLDWTYVSLLESEKNRKMKESIGFEYEEWDHVFDTKNTNIDTSTYFKGWCL